MLLKVVVVVARGGARSRSGPQPDPTSGRSDRRGVGGGVVLPAEGYSGPVPDWPFGSGTARELEVWGKAWESPQAAAWARESWRWETVAMWVRWKVRAESADAGPGEATAMFRLADQVGMSPAGLRENGWSIASDEVGIVREESSGPVVAVGPPERRLRAVDVEQ